MVRKITRRRSAKKHSSKKYSGGAYTVGQAVAPEAPYAQTIIPGTPLTPDCLAATRPGLASPVSGSGGLPGFAGGMRPSLNANSIGYNIDTPATTMLKGGRYTVDVGAGPVNGIGSAGPSAGMALISRIGCEGGLVNTSPSGAMANPTPLTQTGGVGGVDSAYYTAPTAGYGNKPSDFVDSVGAPVLLQQPYDARIMNPACLKTGGRRKVRKSRSSKKSSRKTKRNNKNRR